MRDEARRTVLLWAARYGNSDAVTDLVSKMLGLMEFGHLEGSHNPILTGRKLANHIMKTTNMEIWAGLLWKMGCVAGG